MRLLPADELDGAQRELHERVVGGRRAGQPFSSSTERGELFGPFNALLRTTALGMAVQHVGELLRFEGRLPARLRELAILAVGAGCDYEWYSHSRVALAVGVTHADLDALAAGGVPESCDEREAVALRLCRALPHEVPDELYELARRHFDEAELVELSVLTGYYRLLAGVLATFDVPAPE
ncbi:MAG: carboxymuconolactone decarboxylase family protein [Pseudonocardiaceae bacterium]|nr:carboxymuconolactone decarboxylase family protein [Pseudonocardiaceae bacterium]